MLARDQQLRARGRIVLLDDRDVAGRRLPLEDALGADVGDDEPAIVERRGARDRAGHHEARLAQQVGQARPALVGPVGHRHGADQRGREQRRQDRSRLARQGQGIVCTPGATHPSALTST
ncbi:MAG: hypothetical protein U0807_13675 [Candidatus Binatia bacterium]